MTTPTPTPTFKILPATTPSHIETAKTLFTAYTEWLNLDLTFQNFASELASLPGRYGPPHGALLLAYSIENPSQPLGCVAVRALKLKSDADSTPLQTSSSQDEKLCCEMKRLYVTPEARGLGLGKALVNAIVQRAKELGYREMRLDTLPAMEGAIGLYRRVGFVEIPAYYETPLEETLFLSLDLTS